MVDVLVQFVDSVPHPLTDALVNLAPLLTVAARIVRLIGWSDDWYSSWLTLACWWFLCLATPVLFRYALPSIIGILFVWASRRRQTSLLVTETVLQNAVADLIALRSALPEQVTSTSASLPPVAILRTTAILTFLWLAFTCFVPARIIFAVTGTVFLTHRAPWARILRSVLWRSAFVRTCLYHIRAFLTGCSSPKRVVSNQPTPTTPSPVPSLRFLFTVYENQRWWMGLDWTAALLPSERPSWSSPSFHPLSPPNAFTLPDPATIYLPSPDGKSRIKRTATWRWEEPEWKLVVRKEGTALSRIERSPSSIDEPVTSAQASAITTSGNRLLKAATSKFKESTVPSPSPSLPTSPSADAGAVSSDSTDQNDSEDFPTDPDGWVYSDNKWENQSHRGGLGKYTRYRRWTRIAVVTEAVEIVGLGELGIQGAHHAPASVQEDSPPIPPITPSFSEPKTQSLEARPPTPPSSSAIVGPADPESPLRQRLRAALSKSSVPPPS